MKNKLQGLLAGLVIGSLLTGSAAFAGYTGWLEAFYNLAKIPPSFSKRRIHNFRASVELLPRFASL